MPNLSVKEAVSAAKKFVVDVLAEEKPANVGLEEVEFDQRSGNWLVTVGFSRPWNSARGPLTAISGEPAPKRAYRVITISDETASAIAMKRRDLIDADA